MKKAAKWIAYGLGLYILFLALLFAFYSLSLASPKIANLEKRINPSKFVFWQNQGFFSTPPLFTRPLSDPNGYLSFEEPSNFHDVDIWVILLEGFADIHTFELAQQLSLDPDDIADSEPGNSIEKSGVGINLRRHAIPFYVQRKKIVILDAKYMRENYKPECLDEMVYGAMIGQRDAALRERCKL
ncbi:hypothetical protein J7400_12885 [Shimia sp. R9_2]|uniref:hypothetical protein n=1 Tax=Shimia sp. R9_2 TaxID=2821112 RepID=UPI001ADB18F0|nr:hypothetical protein [Shimia sp. R9_2]MBO9397576.1 hypothetical protein [Shimia sp. R9_2]